MAGILDGVDRRTQLAGRNRLELLLFRLDDDQRYGINVFKVKEVIQRPNLSRVPGSHPVVRGITHMRGQTVTVMDLSLAIGNAPMPEEQQRFVVVTEYNRRTQGFLAVNVDRIVNMKWSDILPPPSGAANASYLTAVTRVDGELVQIIDVEKILSEVVGVKEEASEMVIEPQQDHSSQHILAVDDSSVARSQIKRVLEQLNVAYTLCKDGREALNTLKDWAKNQPAMINRVALVISDIEMPRMDGYTLTGEIRKDSHLQNLFVLLHTSLSGGFNQVHADKVGANALMTKWDPDELVRQVQKRLHEHADHQHAA